MDQDEAAPAEKVSDEWILAARQMSCQNPDSNYLFCLLAGGKNKRNAERRKENFTFSNETGFKLNLLFLLLGEHKDFSGSIGARHTAPS